MNGYIIATQQPGDAASSGRPITVQWIGIMPSQHEMVARTGCETAHLVNDGDNVLRTARAMGLQDGEIRRLNG